MDLTLTRTPRAAPARPVRALLPFTPEVEIETRDLYARMARSVTPVEWAVHAPYIHAINRLKRQRNAVILAHNYQTPEIFHGVADIVGDSLQLALAATKVEADIIVQCGVHFMAETSKILNPAKTVLIPDMKAGCSLAASITAQDVRMMKRAYPGRPVVTYVNTTAEVKAETDICCTSSNAVRIVESLGVPEVIFLPDQYLAKWVASQTSVKILAWHGACEVHERFTGEDLRAYKADDPSLKIIAHPECPPDVIEAADFTGSTAAMIDYAKRMGRGRLVMVTECSMADNVASAVPEIEFVRPCNLCPHMKRITLPKILDCLTDRSGEVLIAPDILERARRPIERMIAVG